VERAAEISKTAIWVAAARAIPVRGGKGLDDLPTEDEIEDAKEA